MHVVRYTLLGLIALFGIAPATAQWTTQSAVPTDLGIQGIAAPTAQRVFVATEDDSFDDSGALFESTDGGTTWTQRAVPFNLGDPLYGIFFLDSQHGWAHGNRNYRTADGGSTWTELPFIGTTEYMEFHTTTFGHALTSPDNWVSRDGGLSWVESPNGLFAFDFTDSQIGLGVSASGIYRTPDSGITFSLVHAGDASAVAFLSSTVAVGIVDGSFVRSTDAGQTWTTGTSTSGRNRLLSLSNSIVLAWGQTPFLPNTDGQILRSTDGGQTWTDLGTVLPSGVMAFAVADAQTLVATDGTGNIYHSANAGLTWAQTFDSPVQFVSFFSNFRPVFSDAQTGYFGYGEGLVVKTTDGGATWNQVSSGYGVSLNDIGRFADGTLIAVGETGTVLTSTGSSPWALHESLSSADLEAVDVVGPQSVVTADRNGRVYRSSDGGDTWIAGASEPVGLEVEDLRFTTLLDGWLVGSGFSSSALFHTTDGGDTWTSVTSNRGLYVAVDFEGSNGWAANVGGLYLRTTDDGQTWTSAELPDPTGFLGVRDMDFYNDNVGYAVGTSGYAARSDDGGVTWEVLPTPNNTDDFTDIFLIGENELWVSSREDRAYYTATGGQNWAMLDIGSEGFGSFNAIAANPAGDAWAVGFQGFIEHFIGPPPSPVNRPPEASYTFVTTRLTVDFTNTSTDPDGTIVSYLWDFGDGATSTEQNPSHMFSSADTYHVLLTVTDDDGETDGFLQFIEVAPGPGGTFGDFTEVTPLEPYWDAPQGENFIVATTAPADYDGDGDLDMAVFGFYVVQFQSVEEHLLLLRNDGEAAPDEWGFTQIDVPLGDLTSGASDMAWGDVDNDGDQDLVVGSNGLTVLYRNDAGALTATDTVLPGYEEDNDQADFDFRSISWADFDNDGDLDLLIPSVFDSDLFEYNTVLLRNDGANGTGGFVFTDADAGLAGASHARSIWADDDGDEDLDLLLVNFAPLTPNGFIRRYRNDGGTFVGEDLFSPMMINQGEVDWSDYDGDGDLDILVVGNLDEDDGFADTQLRVYRNDGGTYTRIIIFAHPSEAGFIDLTAATWADYDSDGDVDILLTGSYNSGSQIDGLSKVYANDGLGNFSDTGNELPAPRASGSRGGSFTWLDIDSEGDLDYFVAGEYYVPGGNNLVENQMHLYRNDATGMNAAPSAPSGLTATAGVRTLQGTTARSVGGGTVTLTWNPASDDHTPTAALTYDLALYNNGVPVASGRHRPEPGNVSAVTNWVLSGLADGTYTWTVRAVDSAFNGGPAAQGTFTVGGGGNQAPAASFTSTATGLTASFTDTSTDADGTVVSWAWDFGDGMTSTEQNPSHAYMAAGSYTVALAVTDDGGLTGTTSQSVTVSEGGGSGPFLEQGGQVVMEAEHFDTNLDRGAHAWAETKALADQSGGSSMEATPDIGTAVRNPIGASPEMSHAVEFSTAGTYYVWLRIYAPDNNGKIVHVGLDGANAQRMQGETTGSWAWVNTLRNGSPATLTLAKPGLHTVHTWMGHDGAYVDKMLLTTDAAFIPTGQGPAESPRGGGGNGSPMASFTHTATGLTVDFDASASTDDGTIVSYAWDFGDGTMGSDVTANHVYAAAGSYTVALTVTDDAGLTDTTSQSITVSEGGGSPIALTGSARFDGRNWFADLEWSPSDGGRVDVYRDGAVVRSTGDDGSHSDKIGRSASGSYDYQICEQDSGDCSNVVTVVVSAATTAEASVALPETFALSGSYPNPFSRETTVRVDVPEVAAVRVSVFDLLGRRVAVLVDAPLEAGYHQLRWNASDLPSGAYLIRMEAGTFAATRRITLVR